MVLVSLHLIKDKKYRMSTHQFYLIILYPFDCCIIFWHGCRNSVHKNDTRRRFGRSAVGMMRVSACAGKFEEEDKDAKMSSRWSFKQPSVVRTAIEA